jgi:hypothetical protein
MDDKTMTNYEKLKHINGGSSAVHCMFMYIPCMGLEVTAKDVRFFTYILLKNNNILVNLPSLND